MTVMATVDSALCCLGTRQLQAVILRVNTIPGMARGWQVLGAERESAMVADAGDVALLADVTAHGQLVLRHSLRFCVAGHLLHHPLKMETLLQPFV